MKLFTVGPVEMFEETMKIGGEQVPYFRNDEFSEVMLYCMRKTKEFLNCDEDGDLITLTCSGTGAMEATILNCFTEDDHLLVIDGGTFGHRFTQICEIHGIPYTPVKLSFGETLTKEKLEDVAKNLNFTALLVNIDETSTAQLYDKKLLSDFCRERGIYFIADCISSFLADELDMKKYAIDAVILSSQKAFSLAPGLAFVALSNKLLTERVMNLPSKTMYLDFKSHIENGRRGQTPFTPAVRVVLEWKKMIERIDRLGIDKIVSDTEERARHFRKGIKSIGLRYPDYPLSNACTPVVFSENNAMEIYKELIQKYGFVVNPSGGELGNKMFRVSHIGNLTIEDNERLLRALKELL